MSSIGRKTQHAGQTTITLTGLHAHFGKARDALLRVSTMLKAWAERAAEQLHSTTVWRLVCDHLNSSSPEFAHQIHPDSSQIMLMESGNCGFWNASNNNLNIYAWRRVWRVRICPVAQRVLILGFNYLRSVHLGTVAPHLKVFKLLLLAF
jgi:hypothetical protein